VSNKDPNIESIFEPKHYSAVQVFRLLSTQSLPLQQINDSKEQEDILLSETNILGFRKQFCRHATQYILLARLRNKYAQHKLPHRDDRHLPYAIQSIHAPITTLLKLIVNGVVQQFEAVNVLQDSMARHHKTPNYYVFPAHSLIHTYILNTHDNILKPKIMSSNSLFCCKNTNKNKNIQFTYMSKKRSKL